MYQVLTGRRLLSSLTILVLTGFLLLGNARRVIHTLAPPRELPIYSVETTSKTAALGINCAWDDSDIDRLLELLDQRSVKATFFIVGDWCDKYPEAVKKLANAGHELGSHSDTHPDMTKLSKEQIIAQLENSKQKIEAVSGQTLRLFRPPSGAYNNLVVTTARELGWEVVQWSNDSIDWKTPPVEEMVERVCKRAKAGDILLFHVGKANTLAALAQILDRLIGEGYEFVPIGKLLLPAPYELDHTGRQFPKAATQKDTLYNRKTAISESGSAVSSCL
ncbi:MAG: polysaccharide deacetylase family protein [Anaerotruncus sp.]|nr:polysaccharide deacetylase family protein [Anaerotruncus sp.]